MIDICELILVLCLYLYASHIQQFVQIPLKNFHLFAGEKYCVLENTVL